MEETRLAVASISRSPYDESPMDSLSLNHFRFGALIAQGSYTLQWIFFKGERKEKDPERVSSSVAEQSVQYLGTRNTEPVRNGIVASPKLYSHRWLYLIFFLALQLMFAFSRQAQAQAFQVGTQNLNVPDYVFEPNYKLLPLKQLAMYVEKEKHLPEIPSAREIKAQSINLGEFQMQLLKKLEELTLYTLQQETTIKTQQHTMGAQAKMIQELQNMLTQMNTRLNAVEQASRRADER